MDWNVVGAVGELLGALAVFGSLMYLAVQIRNSNAIARSESRERANEVFDRWRSKIVLDKELGEIWQKGMASPEALNQEEEFRFGWLIAELIHNLRVQYLRAYELKQQAELDRVRKLLTIWIPQPGFQWAWPQTRTVVEPEFEEVVDDIMKRGAT